MKKQTKTRGYFNKSAGFVTYCTALSHSGEMKKHTCQRGNRPKLREKRCSLNHTYPCTFTLVLPRLSPPSAGCFLLRVSTVIPAAPPLLGDSDRGERCLFLFVMWKDGCVFPSWRIISFIFPGNIVLDGRLMTTITVQKSLSLSLSRSTEILASKYN